MADRLITVGQLQRACVDREWRERWLAGENPPNPPIVRKGGIPVQTELFHEIVQQFTEWLVKSREFTAGLAAPDSLFRQLYDRFARTRFNEVIEEGNLPSAYQLSESLRSFCTHLVTLRSRTAGFKTWKDVFLTQEYRLESVALPVGEHIVKVSGIPDAVRLHSGNVELVDHELCQSNILSHDLVQLAIYARLLRTAKPGLVFNCVLELHEPALHAITASVSELDAVFDEFVMPVLREVAGVATIEPPPPNDPNSSAIEACFAQFHLPVEILGRENAPQLTRYRVKPKNGTKLESLSSRSEDLQIALMLPQAPLIQPGRGFVSIDVPKAAPSVVSWKDAMMRMSSTGGSVSFPIGLGVDNSLLVADLTNANTCHALVTGAAGSGKSEFLKSMLATLITRNSPRLLRLTLMDPKLLTFAGVKHVRHLTAPIIADFGIAIASLEHAVWDAEERCKKLAAEGFESLAQRGACEMMPYRVIVCDEFGDLALREKNDKQQFQSLISQIAQKGRATGIHLVLSTKRPDRNILTDSIKSGFPLKVCFRVDSPENSSAVLDQPGAETLLGHGDLLCARGRGLERAQSPFISQQELRSVTES